MNLDFLSTRALSKIVRAFIFLCYSCLRYAPVELRAESLYVSVVRFWIGEIFRHRSCIAVPDLDVDFTCLVSPPTQCHGNARYAQRGNGCWLGNFAKKSRGNRALISVHKITLIDSNSIPLLVQKHLNNVFTVIHRQPELRREGIRAVTAQPARTPLNNGCGGFGCVPVRKWM